MPELSAGTAFLDALGGGSRALLIEGEPGIGKTTVWLAVVRAAEARTILVLQARPRRERSSRLSYAALADLVGPVFDGIRAELPRHRTVRSRRRCCGSRRASLRLTPSHDGHGRRRRACRACARAACPDCDRRWCMGGRRVVPGTRIRGAPASSACRAASGEALGWRCGGAVRSRPRHCTGEPRARRPRAPLARLAASRRR